jgi:tetratricopeptide (TPR) repeat protein
MKKLFVVAALAFALNAQAQSPDEGIKMYNYERYEAAHKALEAQAGADPKANYYLGLAQIGEGNLEAAKATFSKYPEDAANKAGLARVAFEQKNATQGNVLAVAVAGMAKKKNWEPLLHAADAITYTEGGDYMQAIAWYKKALENAPDNESLLIGLGDAYRQLARTGKISSSGEAMTAYEKAAGKNPNNSLAFSRIGKLWYDARNYPLALESYEKAKNADPSNPLPYRDLANAYHRSGNYEKAKQNIEKYRELSDKNMAVELQYLDILYLAKDYKTASERAKDLLNANPGNPRIHGLYGSALYELGDTTRRKEALDEFGVFINKYDKAKIRPQDYILYGRMNLSNGLTDEANKYFNMGVESDTSKDKSETYRTIAEAFKSSKDYPKSAEWYEKLVSTYPESPAVDYFWRGAMFYYSKDYPNAEKAFMAFENKYPDQPSATYWRGRTAAAQDEEGKTGGAVEHYNKWLEKVGPSYDKKADLMQAYQYLALYYYNKSDKTNMKKYLDEIEKIEPGNAFLKQLRDLEKTMKG